MADELYQSGGILYPLDGNISPGDWTFEETDDAWASHQTKQLKAVDFTYVQPLVLRWPSNHSSTEESKIELKVQQLNTTSFVCSWKKKMYGHEAFAKAMMRLDSIDAQLTKIDAKLAVYTYKTQYTTEYITQSWTVEDITLLGDQYINIGPFDFSRYGEDETGSGQYAQIMSMGTEPLWNFGVDLTLTITNSDAASDGTAIFNPIIVVLYPKKPGR